MLIYQQYLEDTKQTDKHSETNAVKVLSKTQLIEAKQVDHVFNEMSLSSILSHPLIVRLTSKIN